MKLNYDEPLSDFAFKFNMRRYMAVEVAVSELIKENMYHVKRWWATPDALLTDAKAGALRLHCLQTRVDT